MKNIRGHKSWTFDEVVAILAKGGSFTVPTLPHYRYDRVKQIRSKLLKIGAIRKTGKCETSISYAPTDLFKQWVSEFANKKTTLGVYKWSKTLEKSK